MQGSVISKKWTLITSMPQQCSSPEIAKSSNHLGSDFVVGVYYRGPCRPPSLLEDRLSVSEYSEGQRSDVPPQPAHRIHTKKLHRPGEVHQVNSLQRHVTLQLIDSLPRHLTSLQKQRRKPALQSCLGMLKAALRCH